MAFRRAAESAGAVMWQGRTVTAIQQGGDGWRVRVGDRHCRAPCLVNCAGAWAGGIASSLGEAAPVYVEAPMLMITEQVTPFLVPVAGCTARPLSFKQLDNGTLLIGGGYRGYAVPHSNDTELNFQGLSGNLRTVMDLFPFLGRVRVQRCWAGIEAVTPDQLPVIGPSSVHDGLYHAFGFSAHGFQLAPFVGKLIAELVAGKASPVPIEPFTIRRFAS